MKEKYDINKLLGEVDFSRNKYQKVNDKIMLTNYQIEVLTRMKVDIYNASSLSQIILEAEEAYEETEDEELDQVLQEIAEHNYYENTKK